MTEATRPKAINAEQSNGRVLESAFPRLFHDIAMFGNVPSLLVLPRILFSEALLVRPIRINFCGPLNDAFPLPQRERERAKEAKNETHSSIRRAPSERRDITLHL